MRVGPTFISGPHQGALGSMRGGEGGGHHELLHTEQNSIPGLGGADQDPSSGMVKNRAEEPLQPTRRNVVHSRLSRWLARGADSGTGVLACKHLLSRSVARQQRMAGR